MAGVRWREMVEVKGRRSIAVRNTPHRYGNSDAITQCYLPSGGGDIPALTPAEASTQLSFVGKLMIEETFS